jgi:hypothetical protein
MTTKFSKYIITQPVNSEQKNTWGPNYRPQDRTRLLRLDEEVVKGAKLFAAAVWLWPAVCENEISARSTKPHVHDYDEVLGVVGTNPDDPHDLCGETEAFIGGERHIINKSALIYIPAGLEHGPFRPLKMERPTFHFEFRNSGKH